MRVAIYHLSVPKKPSYEKTHMLQFFSEGVRVHGDHAIEVRDHIPIDSDVAVIQGWISDKTDSAHLRLRHSVIQQQIQQGRCVITADSNLFLYACKDNPLHYLRYSINGVFPNTGNYCDSKIDPARWQQIQQDFGIALRSYRSTGNHILICLQRDGGWSMGQQSVVSWCETVLKTLRQYTNRPIIIRPHPGDRKAKNYLAPLMTQVGRWRFSISHNPDLKTDLQNCWTMINHNSSPAVAAAIEGIPVFVTDPARSQCSEIANTDLSLIESPVLPDRTQWIQRLAMSHWKFDELRSGQAWRHMRQFVPGIG